MQEKPTSNVVELTPEKKKKQNKANLYYRVARHMNGYEAGFRTAFPRRYIVIKQSDHVYTTAEVVSESLMIVEFVPPTEIRKTILQWVWEYQAGTDWQWTVDDARKCLDMWLDLTAPMDMPAAVAFASEQKWCFVKHPFNPDSSQKTPVWDEILGRMSNANAAQCFIGSLFFEGSNQQQYLWLKGSGQDSKGCITRLLKKLLGNACKSANPPVMGQNPGFWLDSLMRSKCVVFNDINDRSFVTTGIGKSLTGGDVQSCEKKYGASYDAIFEGKLIFTSNWTPDISSEHSDQRRIIYCELDEKADKTIDPAYEAKLLLEAPGIIAKCMDKYRQHCLPNNKPIPVDNSKAIEIAEVNEDDFELLMERFIVHGIDKNIPLNKNKYIKETEFTGEVRHFFQHDKRNSKQSFKKWLIRKYADKLKFTPLKIGSVTKRCVVGMTIYKAETSAGKPKKP